MIGENMNNSMREREREQDRDNKNWGKAIPLTRMINIACQKGGIAFGGIMSNG